MNIREKNMDCEESITVELKKVEFFPKDYYKKILVLSTTN